MELPLPIRILVLPLASVYGAVVRLKAWLYATGIVHQKRLTAPVISVGNLSVGGTGKTPMVVWLAEKLLAEGKRVAILSRGYRGSGGSSDEIDLMKEKLGDRVLFGVGPDRFAEGRKIAAREAVDIFLLDDGFQHLRLARDADIVLIDSTRPLHKDFLLPAGSLREPVSAVSRATVVLFTRVHQAPFAARAMQNFPKIPIFPAVTRLAGVRPIGGAPALAAGDHSARLFAFCGIGNPGAFFMDLAGWGIEVAGKLTFRDHHAYSAKDYEKLNEMARNARASGFITTEKDLQNLAKGNLSLPLYCCEIAMEIPDEGGFWETVVRSLPAKVGAPA